MRMLRHARTLGRVAALALCCVLVADQDADARRRVTSHRHRSAPSEFSGKPNPPGPIRFPDTRFEPVTWNAIDGWAADDHAAAFATFLASCRALIGSAKSAHDTRPVYTALLEICRKARAGGAHNNEVARKFFEENFAPVRISKIDDP